MAEGFSLKRLSNGEEWITYGDEKLARLNREYNLLHRVRLRRGGPPQMSFWQLNWTCVRDAEDTYYDIDEADPKRFKLKVTGTSRDGCFRGETRVELSREARRDRYRWEVQTELEVLKKISSRYGEAIGIRNERGGRGPIWWLEFSDPFPESAVGPSTPMRRNWPGPQFPDMAQDVFKKSWRKRWQVFAYEDKEGVTTLPLNHTILNFTRSRLSCPMRKGGRAGFFTEKDGNPVFEFDKNGSYAVAICQWGYDAHLVRVLPARGKPSLARGTRIKASYCLYDMNTKEAGTFLKGARPMKVYAGEEGLFENLPAYIEPVSRFAEPVADHPDANAWTPMSSCVWDRHEGRKAPGSLRILNNTDTVGGWTATTGSSQFGNPIEAGKRYVLRAWVKLHDTRKAKGASVGVGFLVVENLGTPNEKLLPYRWHFSKRITMAKDWTLVEFVTPEAPKNTCEAAIVLRLDGRGNAWFDDVQFRPARKT